jgi:type III pantothenate kinase
VSWLLLDCGNSRIKWQFASVRGLIGSPQAVPIRPPENAIESVHQAIADQRPDRIVVANVAGAKVEQAIVHWARRQGVRAEFASVAGEACGVRCAYDRPERLGVDRWMSLIAAFAEFQAAVCIVSAGTAVTVDILDGAGVHRGGLILVGSALAAQALAEHTAGIGRTHSATTMPAGIGMLGRDTNTAVSHGSLLAIASAVDRTVTMAAAEFGQMPQLLLTGGDAERVAPWLQCAASIEPDLVLRGLLKVAAQASFS